MTRHISEELSTRLIDGSRFVITVNAMLPRDPDDDEEDEDEEDEETPTKSRSCASPTETSGPESDSSLYFAARSGANLRI